MRNLAALSIICTALAFSTPAAAVPFLPMATAKTAISTYETAYWRKGGRTVALSVAPCRRHGPSQVSCVTEAVEPDGSRTTVTDWATRLHRAIRIRPGKFAVEMVLVS